MFSNPETSPESSALQPKIQESGPESTQSVRTDPELWLLPRFIRLEYGVHAALAVRFPEKDSEGVRLSGELACTVRTRLEKRVGVRHILPDAGLFARLRQGFQAHTVTDD